MTQPTEQQMRLAARISAQITAGVRHVVFAGAELDTLLEALTAAAPRQAEAVLEPHAYVPSAAHMGDCDVCGHLQGSAVHSPFKRASNGE